MKALKGFTSLFLLLALLLALSVPAFATELAGDEVFDCKITIIISDLSGEYPGDTVMVHFKDVTGTVEQTVDLELGGTAEFVLPGPTTYNFTFEGMEEGYEVVDFFTYAPVVTSFAVTGTLKDFTWGVEKTEDIGTDVTTAPGVDVGAITARENVTVVNEDAEKAYLEFLEAVSFVANDKSHYDGFGSTLSQYERDAMNSNIYCKWYVDYVQGGTEEEFYSMSAFERWLWTNTYTRLAYASGGSGNYNKYFGSEAAFNTYIVDAAMKLVRGNNSDVVIAAYEKLMGWQWDYIRENGVPFNFIRNRNYIEELHAEDNDVTEPQETQTETQEPTDATQDRNVQQDSVKADETTEPVAEEEKGIWSETMAILAKNSVTIIILAILVIAVLIVVYIRKSKDIYGE